MQIIVFDEETDNVFAVECPVDGDVGWLMQLVSAEAGRNVLVSHALHWEDRELTNFEASLQSLGLCDGSSVTLKRKIVPTQSQTGNRPVSTSATASGSTSSSSRQISYYDIPADISPERLLELCALHPHLIDQFKSNDKELGDCLSAGNLVLVRSLLMKRMMSRHKVVYDKSQEIKALEKDPTNPELQKKVEERIRLENIDANLALAMETLPEAFGRVTMLYVDIEVNNHPVKAFVDSGAQSTIMSARCAERCGVSRLIDVRYAGQARGVGTAKILGRIHIAQMKFGRSFFPISITVLENDDVDFLFGLDMLRRYRCNIDLSKNVLAIEGATGKEEIPFLAESDLPVNARGIFEHDKST